MAPSTDSPTPEDRPESMAPTGPFELDFASKASGRGYRLRVWQPPIKAPAHGFPVLWVLDGAGYFGLAVDMVRNRSLIGVEIAAAVVVGVTYPSDDIAVSMTRRYLDFTATPPGDEPWAGGAPTGGVEEFLDTLEHEALAKVAERCPVDARRMAIVGHSLGGHAVLHALFTRPTLFESFLAISPSIWWNRHELLAHEAGFARALADRRAAPRLFIGVGALEERPIAPLPGMEHLDLTRANALIAQARIIENAERLVDRLRALSAPAGFEVRYACLQDETHASVPFAALRPALDLALPFRGFA
jgi:predicted alpha/beta superfamily hydrolase